MKYITLVRCRGKKCDPNRPFDPEQTICGACYGSGYALPSLVHERLEIANIVANADRAWLYKYGSGHFGIIIHRDGDRFWWMVYPRTGVERGHVVRHAAQTTGYSLAFVDKMSAELMVNDIESNGIPIKPRGAKILLLVGLNYPNKSL